MSTTTVEFTEGPVPDPGQVSFIHSEAWHPEWTGLSPQDVLHKHILPKIAKGAAERGMTSARAYQLSLVDLTGTMTVRFAVCDTSADLGR